MNDKTFKELKDLNLELENLLKRKENKVIPKSKIIKLVVFQPRINKLKPLKKAKIIENNVILKLKNVNKIFKEKNLIKHTIKNLSFEIKQRSITTLYGPSGSGKTTILKLIMGLIKPTSGAIYINSNDICKLKTTQVEKLRYNNIGFVFQNYELISDLNVFENIAIVASKVDKTKILELILRLGLDEVTYNYPSSLSGGQQQRVAIARSLVNSPSILICDEPTSALDVNNKKNILKLLIEINEKFGTSILIVSHDENIAHISDQVLTIKNGELIETTSSKEVLDVDAIKWV